MSAYMDFKAVDTAYWGICGPPTGELPSQDGEVLGSPLKKTSYAREEEFADLPPSDYVEETIQFQSQWNQRREDMTAAPEESASLFAKYFFTWLTPFIQLAHSEKLEEHLFPPPRRDHHTQMSGSRLSEDFRQREMLDGRLLWSHCIERVVKNTSDNSSGGAKRQFQVIENEKSEVLFAGEPCIRGRLRWIGSVRCCDAPHKLYCGVEWHREIPSYRTRLLQQTPASANNDEYAGVLHRGNIHGEQLFFQADEEAPPRCTLEPVDSLELLHPPFQYHASYAEGKTPQYPRQPNVMWSLLRSFRSDLLRIIPCAVVQFLCFNVATPILIRWYVQYLQNDQAAIGWGVVLALAFLVVKGMEPLASNKFEQRTQRTAALFRTATLSVLFEKCLTISGDAFAHPEISAGRVLTMASSDVENIKEFPIEVVHLIMAPAILLFVLGNMLFLTGWSALGGVLAIAVVLPIQGLLVNWQEGLQKLASAEADLRLRKTNELLSGIRVVKMMGWEKNFLKSIEEARQRELHYRQRMQLAEVFVSLANDGTCISVLMIVITIYYLSGHELTPEVALPIIAMLGSLMYGLMMFPTAVNTTVKFLVSCRRVSRFLECNDVVRSVEDIQEVFKAEGGTRETSLEGVRPLVARFHRATLLTAATELAVAVLPRQTKLPKRLQKWLSFVLPPALPVEIQWILAGEKALPSSPSVNTDEHQDHTNEGEDESDEESETTHTILCTKVLLRNLSLDVRKKGLTVIVGPTGSGKSLLLQSILNAFELSRDGGRIWATRNVAFVPQQPWIMQDTIRFNITFFAGMTSGRSIDEDKQNRPEDRTKLQRAVTACQLKEDLKDTPNGLDSEIGERGVNLSGGQKARISLARALYADRELYLLDDPLSALDAHVGDRILHDVILGELKEKTVVLATHQLHCLPYAETIIVMKEGEIQFHGSYDSYAQSPWNHDMRIQEQPLAPAPPPDDDIAVDEVAMSPTIPPAMNANEGTHPSFGNAGSPSPTAEPVDELSCPAEEASEASHWMVEEEKEQGTVPFRVYKEYFKSGGGLASVLVAVAVFVLFNATFMIATAWLSLWSAHSFPNMKDSTALIIYLLMQGSALIFAPLSKYCVFRINIRASRTMHNKLLRSVATGTLGFFDSVPLGRVLNRFSKDVYVLDNEIPDHQVLLLDIGCYVLSTLLLAVIAMPKTIVVVVIAAVGFCVLLRYYATIIREVRRRGSIAESPMFSMLESILNNGRETLSAYGKTHFFFQEALLRLNRMYSCMYVERAMDQWLNIRVEYLGGFIMFSVACIGLFQKLHSPDRKMSSETLALISLCLTMCVDLFWSLPLIVKVAAWTEASMNSSQRVLHYMENIPSEDLLLVEGGDSTREGEEVPVVISTVDDSSRFTANATERSSEEETAVEPSGPCIVFDDVSLRYREGLPCVLKNVSFRIFPREKVGVVGRTGSGKSTLLLTFMRLVEICGGTIHVNGKRTNSYSLPELRRQFAFIPQDPVLFEGTVRSNLDPFGESSDAELRRVLELIGLQDASAESPTEFASLAPESTVSEGGKNFSVGQRQLLCMGRALLKKGNSFVLMDEATANVDPKLDRRIQDVIHRCFAPYVVVTIAHRLHTVASYDTIVVMHRGKVVERGTPRDLIQAHSSHLYNMVVRSAVGPSTPDSDRDALAKAAVNKFLDRCKP